MALNALKSSNLEQLALKGLNATNSDTMGEHHQIVS